MAAETSLNQKQPRKTEQMFADEQMVFELAANMLDTYTALLTKNKEAMARAVMRMGVLLKQDPTFVQRFSAARIAVAAEHDKRAKAEALKASAT